MIHSTINLSAFPTDYAGAVEKWSHEVDRLSAVQKSFPLGDLPNNNLIDHPLITQTAWLGKLNAPKVLVLIAGTHGIEGFAGSAVQIDFLMRLKEQQWSWGEDIAALLIHALTPWGYAWYRRCDENGVDLNRNFVDFSQLPVNPGFTDLQPYLLGSDQQLRETAFTAYKKQYGREQFELAVSGGQYIDPLAPFYGGVQPNHGHRVIKSLFEQYQLARRQLAVIDVHTGLGPYGYGEVISDHPLGGDGFKTAKNWYGAAVTVPEQGSSSSVPKNGLLDYAWHRIMQGNSCFITLEFGTLGTASLFEVLLNDHGFWAKTPMQQLKQIRTDAGWQQQWQTVREAMLAHFCPADPIWRESVIFRSRQVLQQALTGLS
ncbi:MAG: DUF2817 domain-containing protein [Gammaproteobacteria bacterium]|nr:DUF2817 domain-containing protein [Gammaproteobacteria bacterium]